MVPPSSFRPSDLVAAKWSDRQYYIAHIVQPVAAGFAVLYGDGDEAIVSSADLVPVPITDVFKIGDHVLACWKSARMFPGVIQEKRPVGYLVAWDDGDPPLVVPFGRLTYFQWATMEPAPQPRVKGTATASVGSSTDRGPELAIFLPGEILPLDRGEQFADPLADVLDVRHLGRIVEEGTSVKEVNGRKIIQGAHIFVELHPNVAILHAVEIICDCLRVCRAPTGTFITDPAGKRTLVA